MSNPPSTCGVPFKDKINPLKLDFITHFDTNT